MDGPGPAQPAACEKDGLKDESGTAAKDTTSIGSSDRVSGADRMGVEVHNYSYIALEAVVTLIVINIPAVKKALGQVKGLALE